MLNGKSALITGGGRGIGRAIALEFARNGARVAVAARTAEQVEQVAAEIGADAVALVCDVSDPESVARMFADMRERFGNPDILVNNAGIAESATLVNTTDELWQRHLAINLSGTFYCTRAALPAMLKRGWGRVINVASIAGKSGAPYIAAYSASKHGVLGLTRSAALELATTGVTVNAICPGAIQTRLRANSARILGDDAPPMTGGVGGSEDAIRAVTPAGRRGTLGEVAAAAVYLASENAAYVTGQTLVIDGGWTAA